MGENDLQVETSHNHLWSIEIRILSFKRDAMDDVIGGMFYPTF